MDDLTEIRKLQAEAYFIDYQAMVSKANWFMSLQYKLFTPLVSFISLGVAAYVHDYHVAGVWVTAAVVEAIVVIYLYALYEVYSHVRYIEAEIKPKLGRIISLSADSFWSYENILKIEGRLINPVIGDAVFPILISSISLGVSVYIRGGVLFSGIEKEWADWLGMIIGIFLLIITVISAINTSVLRKKFEKYITKEGGQPQGSVM